MGLVFGSCDYCLLVFMELAWLFVDCFVVGCVGSLLLFVYGVALVSILGYWRACD